MPSMIANAEIYFYENNYNSGFLVRSNTGNVISLFAALPNLSNPRLISVLSGYKIKNEKVFVLGGPNYYIDLSLKTYKSGVNFIT